MKTIVLLTSLCKTLQDISINYLHKMFVALTDDWYVDFLTPQYMTWSIQILKHVIFIYFQIDKKIIVYSEVVKFVIAFDLLKAFFVFL